MFEFALVCVCRVGICRAIASINVSAILPGALTSELFGTMWCSFVVEVLPCDELISVSY